MIWIFRALMAAGFAVAVMSVAVAALIFLNFDPAACEGNCSAQTRFVLVTPALLLSAVGLITAFVASRLSRRSILEQQADRKS
ncbi:MAG: hypothetical protein AAFV54_17235 [Pseudomonadota bacterium]